MVCVISDGYDINNKFIARFNSLAELEKYAIKTSDVELHGKLKIVKTYNHNLPSLMSKINSKLVKIERVAGRPQAISLLIVCSFKGQFHHE